LLNFAIVFILKTKLNDRYNKFVFGPILSCFGVVFRIYLLFGVKIWRLKKSKCLAQQIKNIVLPVRAGLGLNRTDIGLVRRGLGYFS